MYLSYTSIMSRNFIPVNLKKAIMHSDIGVHYTNNEYVELLKSFMVKQSILRKNNCWDNAPAENFFSMFKTEAIYLKKSQFTSKAAVRQIAEEYFDYYINFRPQKRLGSLAPNKYRRR